MSHKSASVVEPNGPSGIQPWEGLKLTPELQPRHDWYLTKVPVELTTIPDDYDVPQKLKQIIQWSLTNLSPPLPSPVDQDVASAFDGAITESSTARDGVAGSPDGMVEIGDRNSIEKQPLDPSKDTSYSTSHTRHSGWPVKKHRRRPYAPQHHIGQGLFISTLDLITSFKPKAEHEAAEPCEMTAPPSKKQDLVECVSCFEDFPRADTATLPCSHSYCKACLKELVMTAIQNESSFPPKCCLTEIPTTTSLFPLDREQKELYAQKAAEYATPPLERWYCPNIKCLRSIPPRKFSRLISLNHRCPHCSTKICYVCRSAAHRRSKECPQDWGLSETLSLAETEGWRRCFKCRALVERTDGCRHMTCKCGAHFCYICGNKWGTCKCSDMTDPRPADPPGQEDEIEAMLLAEELEQIAQLDAEIAALELREAEERQQEADRLREENEAQELRRLELLRLQEEERKRIEREEEEKELRRILRLSIEEQSQMLRAEFNKLVKLQQQALDHRHTQTEQAHTGAHQERASEQQQRNKDLATKLTANINKRTAVMEAKHAAEAATFRAEQEQAEDDLFLQVSIHLRGKPNKEAREARLRDEFAKQGKVKAEAMTTRFESESQALKQNIKIESEVLQRAGERKLESIQADYIHDLKTLAEVVATDRAWFKYLMERRQNMLSADSRLLLAVVDNGQGDPVGLTEDAAKMVGPFALESGVPSKNPYHRALSKLPAPESAVSPCSSLAELARDSDRLFRTLPPSPSEAEAAEMPDLKNNASQFPKNAAWDFMTTGPSHPRNASVFKNAHQQPRADIRGHAILKRYSGTSKAQPSSAPPLEAPSQAGHKDGGTPSVEETPSTSNLSLPRILIPGAPAPAAAADRPHPAQTSVAEQAMMAAPRPAPAAVPEDHKFIVLPSPHSRQSSTDSAGGMTHGSGSLSTTSTDSSAVRDEESPSAPATESKRRSASAWSFTAFKARRADRYPTEEEIRERMRRAFGA